MLNSPAPTWNGSGPRPVPNGQQANRFPLPALAAVGFTATVGQLLLLRELVAVLYGNELVLGLILAVWLAGGAAGAWGGKSRAPKGWGDRRRLRAGLVLAAALLPAQMALVRGSRALWGVPPGALLPLGPTLLTLLLALAPLCLLLGGLFTTGARLLAEASPPPCAGAAGAGGTGPAFPQGRGIGTAYVAESLGAVAGGVLYSFLLIHLLNPFQVALGVGALDLAVAAGGQGGKGAGGKRWLAGAAVALLAGAWPLGTWLHRATLGRQYAGLRLARDSVYGRIVVTGAGEQRVFFENGLLFFETQGTAAEEVAHLPLLAHPRPRRVLLIGGGVSGVLAETLKHPSVEAVHYVEMDPLLVTIARQELPPEQAAAFEDPRVTLAHTDGRRYVQQMAGQARFDAILLDLPEPATGQLNRFYTQEFFGEVRAALAPGGVFALGLPWQENYPGPALRSLAAGVYRALGSRFAAVALLPGERLFLLAADSPLPADAALLSARLGERGLATRWVTPPYLHYLLTTDRTAQARHLLETAPAVRLNRDLEPACYLYALAVWLSRFSTGLSRLAAGAWGLRLGWAALLLVPVTLLLRRRPVAAAVGFTGLAGMALQVILLFAFQVMHGSIYGQVGLVVTGFMAGLALGSLVGQVAGRPWRPKTMLLGGQAGIALFALGLAGLVHLAPPVWAFPLLALMGGGLVGLVFPLAVACVQGESGQVAGQLYGADLLGGCLGAALTGSLLLPVLGIPHTCLAVALVGLAGLAVLL